MNNPEQKSTPESIANYVSEGNPNVDQATDMNVSYIDQNLRDEIRQALEKETSLSGVLKSLGITAANGVVTLQGQVCSKEQMLTITDKAASIAGRDKISNQLNIVNQP